MSDLTIKNIEANTDATIEMLNKRIKALLEWIQIGRLKQVESFEKVRGLDGERLLEIHNICKQIETIQNLAQIQISKIKSEQESEEL